jgi:hypothetical protein
MSIRLYEHTTSEMFEVSACVSEAKEQLSEDGWVFQENSRHSRQPQSAPTGYHSSPQSDSIANSLRAQITPERKAKQ